VENDSEYRMFTKLFQQLLRRPPPPGKDDAVPATDDALDRQAPLRQTATDAPSVPESTGVAILCREALLDRQQEIAGYQFLLHEATHSHIQRKSRRILHLCAEILVQNLVSANIDSLLGKRLIFLEIPDSFLDHPCLSRLPPNKTFFIIKPLEDPGSPSQEKLLAQVLALRAAGYRIGIPDPISTPEYASLLPHINLIFTPNIQVDVERGIKLIGYVLAKAPHVALLVRDLRGIEDFNFYHKLGISLFQGPFIVSREQWQETELGPDFTHLTMLLNKLRQDADTHEVVALLKRDAAITLRLLRYINSAANGLREHVSSVEHAITLLGRAPLQRWLMLMLCSGHRNQPRAGAVLETALVRARTMELISRTRSATEREAIFLTGLLSLIDVVLQQPIERALEALSIDAEIREAILEGRGPYAATLALARACESLDGDRIVSAAHACGIDPEQASICYMEALTWALALQQENRG
jgi:EAL and modified HD-GYP domain-containing signal transduction protein